MIKRISIIIFVIIKKICKENLKNITNSNISISINVVTKTIQNSCHLPNSKIIVQFFKVFLTKYKILKINIQPQNDYILNFTKY